MSILLDRRLYPKNMYIGNQTIYLSVTCLTDLCLQA